MNSCRAAQKGEGFPSGSKNPRDTRSGEHSERVGFIPLIF
jgi:hypothetical protein